MSTTDFHPAVTIAWREVRDQLRDWRIIGPVVLLAVVFPYLVNYSSGRFIEFARSNGASLASEQLSPFLLMVVGFFPLSVSLVIALESFVGEKERRTLEPLLSSPLSDLQLFAGKLLAVSLPPLLVSYLGMGVYLLGGARSAQWLPTGTFLAQIYFLTTVNGLLMVSAAVVVSAQATSMRAANLLAAFIILPMSMVLLGQSVVIVRNDIPVLWWTILGELVVAVLLIRAGLAHFNREELLGREFDALDLRGGWYTFWDAFVGEASTPLEWYRREIGQTLRRLALPMFLVAAGLALGMLLGAQLAERFA
jgi:ABC-type transport system involved in multi-copper enzyme maturation permease subunit